MCVCVCVLNYVYNFYDVHQHTAHLLLLYKGVIIQFSTVIVDFNLFYDGSVCMQLRALPRRSPLGVSYTQVAVMACGPVPNFWINIYFDSTIVSDPPKKPRVF